MSERAMSRVLIVGCGIGGITAALSLRRLGFRASVIEQAPALATVGAGIQLSANPVRVLRKLGIGAELETFGVRPEGLAFRLGASGERILWTPLGEKAERAFGAPYYHAHRADLLAAMVARLGREDLHLGSRVVAVEEDARGVAVRTEGGAVHRGDILVGADGIHSLVRRTLFGADRPRFAGNVAWRALVPAERLAHLDLPRISAVWMGPNRSVVDYWVSGGRLMNWIGIARAPESVIESWTARGKVADALAEWDGWHPDVTGMIGATPPENLFKTGIYDRDPLERWSVGRITLLGDAAHPMLPFHAQGAAMAIEDGYVLAGSIAETPDDLLGALRRYEARRIDRANWVQAFSRAAEELFHMTDPLKIAHRNATLPKRQAEYPDGFPPGQVKLYGYDVDSAFREPPRAVA